MSGSVGQHLQASESHFLSADDPEVSVPYHPFLVRLSLALFLSSQSSKSRLVIRNSQSRYLHKKDLHIEDLNVTLLLELTKSSEDSRSSGILGDIQKHLHAADTS